MMLVDVAEVSGVFGVLFVEILLKRLNLFTVREKRQRVLDPGQPVYKRGHSTPADQLCRS